MPLLSANAEKEGILKKRKPCEKKKRSRDKLAGETKTKDDFNIYFLRPKCRLYI